MKYSDVLDQSENGPKWYIASKKIVNVEQILFYFYEEKKNSNSNENHDFFSSQNWKLSADRNTK
jgi:hypothetical protein